LIGGGIFPTSIISPLYICTKFELSAFIPSNMFFNLFKLISPLINKFSAYANLDKEVIINSAKA